MSFIPKEILELLRGKRNLLAFSYGVDSTALFYLLLDAKIEFDIALVNYNLRDEAKIEAKEAKELAKRYNLEAFIREAPEFNSNFEAKAREFRYNFFEELIDRYSYDNLLSAHQLNDALEWLLMRLSRGAGVVELVGLEKLDIRYTPKRRAYTLIRPLLDTPKFELEEYLNKRGLKYFIDKSNEDIKYERNYFRREIASKMVNSYSNGIKRSLEYLRDDAKFILKGVKSIFKEDKLAIFLVDEPMVLSRVADRFLKSVGYLLSAKDREAIKLDCSIVVGRKWAIESRGKALFIAPYIKDTVLPKSFKEECRRAKIPPKIRGYLYKSKIELDRITLAFS